MTNFKKYMLAMLALGLFAAGFIPAFYGTYVSFVEPGMIYLETGRFSVRANQQTLVWMAVGYALAALAASIVISKFENNDPKPIQL